MEGNKREGKGREEREGEGTEGKEKKKKRVRESDRVFYKTITWSFST